MPEQDELRDRARQLSAEMLALMEQRLAESLGGGAGPGGAEDEAHTTIRKFFSEALHAATRDFECQFDRR